MKNISIKVLSFIILLGGLGLAYNNCLGLKGTELSLDDSDNGVRLAEDNGQDPRPYAEFSPSSIIEGERASLNIINDEGVDHRGNGGSGYSLSNYNCNFDINLSYIGSSKRASIPVPTYLKPGTYTCNLTFTNNSDSQSIMTKNSTAILTVRERAQQPASCPAEIHLDTGGPDPTNYVYGWSFGYGNPTFSSMVSKNGMQVNNPPSLTTSYSFRGDVERYLRDRNCLNYPESEQLNHNYGFSISKAQMKSDLENRFGAGEYSVIVYFHGLVFTEFSISIAAPPPPTQGESSQTLKTPEWRGNGRTTWNHDVTITHSTGNSPTMQIYTTFSNQDRNFCPNEGIGVCNSKGVHSAVIPINLAFYTPTRIPLFSNASTAMNSSTQVITNVYAIVTRYNDGRKNYIVEIYHDAGGGQSPIHGGALEFRFQF